MTVLGESLRIWMGVNKVTCRRLASRIGISASTVNRICNGEQMDAKTLMLVMSFLIQEIDPMDQP